MPPPGPNAILLEKLHHPVEAFALSHFLDARGIPVLLQETPLRGVLGEIPFLETGAKLYLLDPTREKEARQAILLFRQGPQSIRGSLWKCKGCGEHHEPEFAACWNCGALRQSPHIP